MGRRVGGDVTIPTPCNFIYPTRLASEARWREGPQLDADLQTRVVGQNRRSSNQAIRTASPELQKPLNREVRRLLSLMTLAATVPTTTPITSGRQARRPDMIKMPTAMPDAGQNTATSEGAESKPSPSRAARSRRERRHPPRPKRIHPLPRRGAGGQQISVTSTKSACRLPGF